MKAWKPWYRLRFLPLPVWEYRKTGTLALATLEGTILSKGLRYEEDGVAPPRYVFTL
jgi:hypothetical protein